MISRRSLMRFGGVSLLSPLLSPLAFAGERERRQSFSFAFFSDSHVGLTTHINECGQMLKEMAATPTAFAIDAGDITDFGWPDQYVQFRKLVDPLPFKVYTTPGNHDVRWSPLGQIAYRNGTGNPVYSSFDHGGVHFVLLDCTIPLSHYGHFEQKMLTWLARDLEKVGRETPIFLAFHQWIGRDGVQNDNDVDLFRIIEPYNVKVALNGHGHSDLLWTWNGIWNTMNRGLFQLSYERIEIDWERGEMRLGRRTRQQPQMTPLLTLPLAPQPGSGKKWPVGIGPIADAAPHVRDDFPQTKEYRWDDRPWKAILPSGMPDEVLPPGIHRLTVRTDPQTYFFGGDYRVDDGKGRLRVRWEKPLTGGVMSHLRLEDGRLYVSAMDGSLTAFDAEDGRTVWTASTGGYCHSSPLVRENLVVVGSADRFVHAFDRASGKPRWRFETQGPVYASAAEAGGIVAVGSGDGFIYGIEAASGKPVWRFPLPKSETAFVQSPATTDGARFYFGAWDKFLYALDAATGNLAWKHDCCDELNFQYSPAIGGPVTGAGKVYVPTDGNRLYCFDAESGKVLWQVSAPGDKVGYSGPCLVGDRIYIGCLGDIGQVRCFSANDGSILWTADVGSTIYDSSPSFADGVVAIGSVIGLLSAISASDGRILGQYQLPPGHFLSSPVSAPGAIYAASFCNRVFRFDLTA